MGEAIEARGSTPKYSNLACRQICCTSIVKKSVGTTEL